MLEHKGEEKTNQLINPQYVSTKQTGISTEQQDQLNRLCNISSKVDEKLNEIKVEVFHNLNKIRNDSQQKQCKQEISKFENEVK